MGHQVLLADHHGHIYHRGFEMEGLPVGFCVIKCCFPLGTQVDCVEEDKVRVRGQAV